MVMEAPTFMIANSAPGKPGKNRPIASSGPNIPLICVSSTFMVLTLGSSAWACAECALEATIREQMSHIIGPLFLAAALVSPFNDPFVLQAKFNAKLEHVRFVGMLLLLGTLAILPSLMGMLSNGYFWNPFQKSVIALAGLSLVRLYFCLRLRKSGRTVAGYPRVLFVAAAPIVICVLILFAISLETHGVLPLPLAHR